jgi:hypothetical protein
MRSEPRPHHGGIGATGMSANTKRLLLFIFAVLYVLMG